MRLIVAALLVALWVGEGRGQMAYELVYEQDWSAGESTFTGTGFYDRSVDGADPLYPEMVEAEMVEVRSGTGPAGENALDFRDNGGGFFPVYQDAGVWLEIGPYTIAEGRAEIWYRPNATSLSEVSTAILMGLFPASTGGTGNAYLEALESGGTWTWRLRYRDEDGFTKTQSNIHTPTGLQDVWRRIRIDWKNAAIGAGAYLRVYDGSTLVFELDTETFSGVGIAAINNVHIGFHGLWGETTNFRLYRLVEGGGPGLSDPPTPIVESSPECCANPPTTGAVPDPIGTLPAWTQTCEGGGAVESIADLADGESWL